MKKLQELLSRIDFFAPQEQEVIKSFQRTANEIEKYETMKLTDGWKTLSKKVKEEIVSRITDLVKGDPKIMTLLEILATVETKQASDILEEQIKSLLPAD